MPLLLWMIGEQDLASEAVKYLGQTYGPELQFTILALRALSRVEPLTQHEKCSILRQVSPTKQYAPFLSAPAATSLPGQATAAPPGGPSISPAWVSTTVQRGCHVVAMYEQCLMLCAAANIASGYPIANPFEQPSRLFDGLRLTVALEGKTPPAKTCCETVSQISFFQANQVWYPPLY